MNGELFDSLPTGIAPRTTVRGNVNLQVCWRPEYLSVDDVRRSLITPDYLDPWLTLMFLQ